MEHTVSAYDDDLKSIARMVTEIGGLAERAVGDSVTALTRLDTDLARRVIAGDRELDRLQRDIEDKAILVIARRQPMASDLREIVGAMRLFGIAESTTRVALTRMVAGGDLIRDDTGHTLSERLVQRQHLDDLVADGVQRVQRRHRLLEDHADARAADAAHLALALVHQVFVVEADGAAAVRGIHQSQHRQRGDTFA